MNGVAALQARLLYGCGLRLMECLRLRIKDVDVGAGTLTVRGGKGDKDRVLTLPRSSISELTRQMEYARALHGSDQAAGGTGVEVPGALEAKAPSWARRWAWLWLCPVDWHSTDPGTGRVAWPHLCAGSM